MDADVVVIGAGSAGLAVLRALGESGLAAECVERGSNVGGLWRYENDNGMSSAYASLRTNVSRLRMQYPSFPMPASVGDFPHHTDMAAYLDAYADELGLRRRIRFGATVERLEPLPAGGWRVALEEGAELRCRAAVLATGHDWCPRLPGHPGRFDGEVLHSHDYRTPGPFAGRRVLVVGAGQSAAEIAVEVSAHAARTCLSIRLPVHVVPRWLDGAPYDARDTWPGNRLPWRLLNRVFGRAVERELGPLPASWPLPDHRLLEQVPTLSSELLPALRGGAVAVRPPLERLDGDRVRFAGGAREEFDAIVYATGYRVALPFLAPELLRAEGRRLPLYRRIVPPGLDGLFLAGFVDAPGGLLPLVEAQGDWIAAVLEGRLALPAAPAMWRAIGRAERRTRARFPAEHPDSIRCDPHAYRRLLRADLRRARRRYGSVPERAMRRKSRALGRWRRASVSGS
jgi:cation diffusion facilitator CzcD-associated flavoprotein CzcO